MQITKKELDEFKKIYKEEFKEDISDEKALELATKLINLMKIIYR